MSALAPPFSITPEDVERAAARDGKRYELIDGELKEKEVGFKSLWIAGKISERLNAHFFPRDAVAAVEPMTYCFGRSNHGRKPDVALVSLDKLPSREMPEGDLRVVPDLVVEVLSPSNSGFEIEVKLDEYLAAGIPLVWIVHPDRRT